MNKKWYYALGDLIFMGLTVFFLVRGEITNALIAWATTELYSIQRKQVNDNPT